jgi:hypothetical protein
LPDSSDYLGREEVGSDSYLGPTKYRLHLRCLRCGKEYTRIVARVTDHDPPCPRKRCRALALEEEISRRAENMSRIIESGRAPATTGNNPLNRAVDKTAEIVMQDHGLTNLKDNIREGEITAPPLPPKMQAAADNFFSGKVAVPGGDDRRRKQMELLGRRAMGGAFRNMAINPGAVHPGARGEKGLRFVGTEKLK